MNVRILRSPPPNVIITYEESIRFEIDIYFVLSSIYLFIYFPLFSSSIFKRALSLEGIKKFFSFSVLSFELTKKEKESKFLFPSYTSNVSWNKIGRKEFYKYLYLIIIASIRIRIKMKFIFSFLFNKDIQRKFFTKRMSLYVWKASSRYYYYYYFVSPLDKRISIFDRKIEDPPPEIFHHFPFDLRAGTVAAHPEDSLRCRGRSIHPVLDPRLRIPRQENFHPTGLVCHLCPLIEDRSKRYP